MIEGLFSQTNYMAAKRLMDASVLRHEAIAGNLANAETPGYKRVDVASSFQEELNRALGSKDKGALAGLKPELAIDRRAVARPDGNTVQLEDELMELNKNAVAHSLETQLVTGALSKLRMAITGRG